MEPSDSLTEFDINPGKRTLTHKAAVVDIAIEMAFSPAFDGLAIALVFWNVGVHA
jgi:hypothetical protein